MNLEIEVHRGCVKALPRLVIMLGMLIGLSVFYGLGHVVSPRTADGRPVLLLPTVRAVDSYRRQAVEWRQAWRSLDSGLNAALSAPDGGLLEQSRKAQSTFEAAIGLAQAVDATDTPPTLLGLHDQVAQTAAAYVDASTALNRWLSAPSAENRASADQAYRTANVQLVQLEANAWLQAGGK